MKALSVTLATAAWTIFAAAGCQVSAADAKKALAAELAIRRASMEQSMRLYAQGVEAYGASDHARARKVLAEAVDIDSRNVYAWLALGVVEFECDNLFESASAFHRAARLAPGRYEPHYNIGLVQESVGRYETAAEAYEAALTLAPEQLEVMENLARCYIAAQKEPARAKELMEMALRQESRPEWRSWLIEESRRLALGGQHPPREQTRPATTGR